MILTTPGNVNGPILQLMWQAEPDQCTATYGNLTALIVHNRAVHCYQVNIFDATSRKTIDWTEAPTRVACQGWAMRRMAELLVHEHY